MQQAACAITVPRTSNRLRISQSRGHCSCACLYSVPFVPAGKQPWLKATDTFFQAFHWHEVVATHSRLRKPSNLDLSE